MPRNSIISLIFVHTTHYRHPVIVENNDFIHLVIFFLSFSVWIFRPNLSIMNAILYFAGV